ncbi:Glycosyl transferase, group 2 family protein [Vibrio chagasii]|nr:Glycosyl transferase, group 2 family protein [Vibrio chagasii]
MVCLDKSGLFTIDILVSTYGDRLSAFVSNIPPEIEGVRYLIGHQNHPLSKLDTSAVCRSDITYYSLDSIGVTKSRNYLLERSKSDIVYFCDDDISLVDGFETILRKSHNNYSSSVITFPISTEYGTMRKKFPSQNKFRNRFSILSVGTIEISIKGEVASLSLFPEDMGAGAQFPIGDEAVFLSKFIDMNRKIYFMNEVICSHPEDSSGAQLTINSAYSRGLTLRRVFPLFSFVLALPFFFFRMKLFLIEGSYMNGFKAFLKGLFKVGLK